MLQHRGLPRRAPFDEGFDVGPEPFGKIGDFAARQEIPLDCSEFRRNGRIGLQPFYQ